MKRRRTEETSALLYGRLWQVLIKWFRVPAEPPALPARRGERVRVFQPSEGYLRYRKFWFWLVLTAVDIPLVGLWIWTAVLIWWLGLLLAPVFLVAIVVPDLLAYVSVHLRYDTMWYALSERSMRIRHGIWVIQEKTITFENVQNLHLRQGPVERHFGIARIIVQTAGGGAGTGEGVSSGHSAAIEGVDNAPQIRDLIMEHVRRSKPAEVSPPEGIWLWTPAHVEALGELRDQLRQRLIEGPGHAG